MEEYPSLSQSIYAIRPDADGGLVAAPVLETAPARSRSGCWIAGFVITIIIIALIIWLVVVLVNNPDTGCVDNGGCAGCNGYRSCRTAAKSTATVQEYEGPAHLEELAKGGIVLLVFVANWCGHCSAFKPALEAANAELKERDSPNTILYVTDKANKHTAEAQKAVGLVGFPSVFMVARGGGLKDAVAVQLKERTKEALLAQFD